MTKARFKTVKERSVFVEARVNDAVDFLGHGNRQWGMERFVRGAINAGERRKLRLWKDNTATMFEMGMYSLKYLLGDLTNPHTGGKGTNHAWVLDLWEAALDDLYREKDFHRDDVEHVSDPAVDQLEAGVQPFKTDRSLALRVLDAFTDRDSAKMLELALEIERLEVSGRVTG